MADENNKEIMGMSLDDFFETMHVGSLDKAIGNNLYGIDHMGTGGAVLDSKKTVGLTFFTRPQLNLQSDNIRNNRKLTELLSENENSIHRVVRCTLDPRLKIGHQDLVVPIPPLNCPLVDNDMAFIPMLTNSLTSMSGFPDMEIGTFTSKPGRKNESYSQIDGNAEIYRVYDVDCTFRNTRGDPIPALFYTWNQYSAYVFEGYLNPYVDYMAANRIDYTTRFYRLVLDYTKTYVLEIYCCGASFPTTIGTGQMADFRRDKVYIDNNKDLNVRFKCMGFMFFDEIIIRQFNATVVAFNSNMNDTNRPNKMIKLDKKLKYMFNYRGYPRIDPETRELEWWYNLDIFSNRTSTFFKAYESPDILTTDGILMNSDDEEFVGD